MNKSSYMKEYITKKMRKFTFIILTWNSEKTIDECLVGIWEKCSQEKMEYEIIVVENGSHDSTIDIIKRNMARMPINLIPLPGNLGTTKSRNMAFKQCSGDVICVLDSDAVLLEGSLHDIVDTLLNDLSIGILSPKMIFPDGTIQNTARKFPSVLSKLSRIPCIIFNLKSKEIDGYNDFPFSRITEVDYSISACWFFRHELLDKVGYFDEKIFYSPEDIDYGLRVWKAGKKTVYYPHFTVIHYVQQITHKRFLSKIAFSHFFGLMYYFRKHKYLRKPVKDQE